MKAANDAQHSAQIAQNNAQEAAANANLSNIHDISSVVSHPHGSQYEASSHHTLSVAASTNTDTKAQPNRLEKISEVAPNHKYDDSEFKPSKQYNYAGY